MSKKYNKYTNFSPCKELLKSDYAQCIINIIDDDESFITEQMKVEFFEYMQNFKTGDDIFEHCNTFFNQPKGSDFATKKYLLKGKVVADGIYKKNIGRVASRNGLRWNINSSIIKSFARSSAGISPISDEADESIIDLFSVDYEDATDCNLFRSFIADSKIENFLIQPSIMWTFEGYYDDDVFMGYELKDLPCILGLPGPDGTSKNYENNERLAFSIQIPYGITVRKPTSFDAQMMPVWRLGGKTKPHTECAPKFGNTGFDEYVHEPVTLKQITSQFYTIKK